MDGPNLFNKSITVSMSNILESTKNTSSFVNDITSTRASINNGNISNGNIEKNSMLLNVTGTKEIINSMMAENGSNNMSNYNNVDDVYYYTTEEIQEVTSALLY